MLAKTLRLPPPFPGLRVLCTVHCAAAWQARKVPRIAPPALPTPPVGTNKRQRDPGDGILWGIDWREEAPVSGAQRPPAPAWHRGAPVTCQWSVDQIVNRASVEHGWVACAAKAYASGGPLGWGTPVLGCLRVGTLTEVLSD
jgi:hypothetical protein